MLKKLEFVIIYNNERMDYTARSKELLVQESIVKYFPINPDNKVEFTS